MAKCVTVLKALYACCNQPILNLFILVIAICWCKTYYNITIYL